jgi:hypothetical protein
VRLSHRTDAAQQRPRHRLEASQLAAMGEKLREPIARWTRPAILGTVIGSAGMNAFAFSAQTTTAWMTSAAVTLGIAPGARLRAAAGILAKGGLSAFSSCGQGVEDAGVGDGPEH